MVRSLLLYAVLLGIIAYIIFLVFGNLVSAQIANDLKKVTVHDALGPGMHTLTGMVMVPTGCHRLFARTQEIDRENYLLLFNTWMDSAAVCNSDSVPRRFALTLFAPPVGVAFQATLNDIPIPLEIIPAVQ